MSTDPTHPVQVDAVFDPATGVLTWTMTSTDPLTGQLSLDPLAGFLPPDNAQGQGEGFVTYTAKPIAALATGATITNQASVVFDTNAPIDTPTTINTLDATPPVTTASPSGTAGANGWYTGSVQVALSAIDAGSGVAATWYAVDGGTPQTYDGSPFTVTGDGTHTVTFYSIDNVGNQEPNETETLKIDTAPPVTTASLSGTAGTNGWYTGSVQVALSATDAGSGVASTWYAVDGGTLQTYNGSPFTVTDDGTHTVTFYSMDNAGNQESDETTTFKIDTVPPVSNASLSGTAGNNGWYTASVKVTLAATDATSGVASTDYRIDGGTLHTYGGSPFTVTGDGTHTVTFYSVDNAGNQEPTRTATIKIDTTPPTSTVAALPAVEHGSSFSVSWSGLDGANGSGIASYSVYVSDNGGPLKALVSNTTGTSATFGGAQDGHTYGFYCVATDKAGNVQSMPAQAQATTQVYYVSAAVAPLPAYEKTKTFTVSWSGSTAAPGAKIANYTVYVSDDGAAPMVLANATTKTSLVFTGKDGNTYVFYCVATDSLGHVLPASVATRVTTLVDVTAPTCTVLPLPPYEKTSSFTVSWSGSDGAKGSGIASYTVYVSDNGGAFQPWISNTTTTAATFTAGADGHTYRFYALATDRAGNVSQSRSPQANTLVDLTPPTGTVAALPKQEKTTTFAVSWSGSDGRHGSGLASYAVWVSENGGKFQLWIPSTTKTSAKFTGQAGNTYAFYSVATDNAGNVQPTPSQPQATTTIAPPGVASAGNALTKAQAIDAALRELLLDEA